jgi:hypothetical protein
MLEWSSPFPGIHTMRTPTLLLLAAVALAGCDSSGPRHFSTQPPASNTGFFALVTAGDRYKLYLPAQSSPTGTRAKLAVVDPATPHGGNGLIRFVDLGADGAPQAVGSSGTEVVAVDASLPVVYFLDATTDLPRGQVTLPLGSEPIVASDNASYSMGAAVDAKRRKAWVSVSTGLLEYDLDTFLVTGTFNVPVTENFAYDPAAGRLIAPFYLCDPDALLIDPSVCTGYVHPAGPTQTDGLTLIELDAPTRPTYTLADSAALDPQSPLGREPDAVAVDFSLGVAVVAVEDPSTLQLLDLGAVTTDPVAMTFGAPTLVAAVDLPGVGYTQVAAEGLTHLALAAQEYGNGLVVVDLVKAKAGVLVSMAQSMPNLPDGTPWVNRGDPHGIGIGLLDGRPYAFLVSRNRDWIARIDLRGVVRVLSGAGTFAAQVAYFSVPAPP